MLPCLLPFVPREFGTYFEPFLGGGALFFAVQPERAVLSDANQRLVRAYAGVRDNVDAVANFLRRSPHSKDFFLRLRDWNVDKADDASVAAWMTYLNRTCFNGLYRVNRSGHFNVPFYKNPLVCDEPNLRACSAALTNVEIHAGDFAVVLERAKTGDFVYLDPPYLPISATSSFTGYTPNGFGLRGHRRLRDVAIELKARGVHVLISNSAAPAVLEVYAEGFDVRRVQAPRAVAAKRAAADRGAGAAPWVRQRERPDRAHSDHGGAATGRARCTARRREDARPAGHGVAQRDGGVDRPSPRHAPGRR